MSLDLEPIAADSTEVEALSRDFKANFRRVEAGLTNRDAAADIESSFDDLLAALTSRLRPISLEALSQFRASLEDYSAEGPDPEVDDAEIGVLELIASFSEQLIGSQ